MINDYTKLKKSLRFFREHGCLALLLISIFLILAAWFVWIWISESTVFLKTKNVTLVRTYDLREWKRDQFLQDDPIYSCYLEKNNKTSVIFKPRYSKPETQGIILKESDDFLVLVEYTRRRGFNIYPRWKFGDESDFSFYRIKKEKLDDNSWQVKTVFLGRIHTNYYGAWTEGRNRNKYVHPLSISPDGKFITMIAHGANSYSLGKFRNKEVLLIWEIGDNVVEKDIVDAQGNKIPITIITE